MDEELNTLLKKAYHRWKDDANPPVPIAIIMQYLELEGVKLEFDGE